MPLVCLAVIQTPKGCRRVPTSLTLATFHHQGGTVEFLRNFIILEEKFLGPFNIFKTVGPEGRFAYLHPSVRDCV
ncbi:hypothetical protein RUM44_004792 [Polyplax serrata]|uniref:Uncharacterized protein n=1 Tax=Polyplax serrata TaxID=468196 RepID=A0ABR1B3V8_POLSC